MSDKKDNQEPDEQFTLLGTSKKVPLTVGSIVGAFVGIWVG